MDAKFSCGWNQKEGKDTGSFLYQTGYTIYYENCPIIWVSQIQTEILLSTTEAEYITLNRAIKEVLPFFILMKGIEFVLELQEESPKVLCSILENPVTVHEDNQGAIVLAVAPQLQPYTKNTAIKYHYFRSFFAHGDV